MDIVFSDIDGTCVHYETMQGDLVRSMEPRPDGLWDARAADGSQASLIRLPPSSSGAQGVISARTLRLYAALRAAGAKVVLISGGRLSTILQRLPFLPQADAIVCESGGRIFYPSAALPTAGGWLAEDIAWREGEVAPGAGPPGQDGVRPEARTGPLWQQYKRLKELGFTVDAVSYTTAFRVRVSAEQRAPLLEALASLPAELTTTTNLGAVDIYPAASGKANAAQRLMRRFGAPSDGSTCVFMCDDENDLELAFQVKKAYLPAISHESVQHAVEASPEQFYVARRQGVWATEEVLEQLIQLAVSSKT